MWVDGGKILRLKMGLVMEEVERQSDDSFCHLSWDEKWCSYIEIEKDITAIAEVDEGVVWVGDEDGRIGCFSRQPQQTQQPQQQRHSEMVARWLETQVSCFGVSQILKVGERHVWTWWKDGACVVWQ